jgi:hypothetical protein
VRAAYPVCKKAAEAGGSDTAADFACMKYFNKMKPECGPCICMIARMEHFQIKGCWSTLSFDLISSRLGEGKERERGRKGLGLDQINNGFDQWMPGSFKNMPVQVLTPLRKRKAQLFIKCHRSQRLEVLEVVIPQTLAMRWITPKLTDINILKTWQKRANLLHGLQTEPINGHFSLQLVFLNAEVLQFPRFVVGLPVELAQFEEDGACEVQTIDV